MDSQGEIPKPSPLKAKEAPVTTGTRVAVAERPIGIPQAASADTSGANGKQSTPDAAVMASEVQADIAALPATQATEGVEMTREVLADINALPTVSGEAPSTVQQTDLASPSDASAGQDKNRLRAIGKVVEGVGQRLFHRNRGERRTAPDTVVGATGPQGAPASATPEPQPTVKKASRKAPRPDTPVRQEQATATAEKKGLEVVLTDVRARGVDGEQGMDIVEHAAVRAAQLKIQRETSGWMAKHEIRRGKTEPVIRDDATSFAEHFWHKARNGQRMLP
jgi:hypothetical protein